MKIIRYIFIILVLLLSLVPSILMIGGYKNPNRENRVLASMPKLITKNGFNTEFLHKLDDYSGDRFALKDLLVSAFNSLDIALLGDINSTNAVIGKEEHIFYGETVNDYLGIEQLSREETESIARYLKAVQEELEGKGAKLVFLTAPNKATVYPELMPGWLKPTDEARNIDMLNEALEETGVLHVDAKALLVEAKSVRDVYYKRDSHWNNFGAALVYNAIAEMNGLDLVDTESFTTAVDRTGDLNAFVWPMNDRPEERLVYPDTRTWSSVKPIDFERDKSVETTSDANGLTMLVYHDSFGRSLQPFLSQSVGSLYMNSYFPYDLTFVERYSPDIVVIELVERNLKRLAEHAKSLGYQ